MVLLKDLKEIPENVTAGLTIIPVALIDEVLAVALAGELGASGLDTPQPEPVAPGVVTPSGESTERTAH